MSEYDKKKLSLVAQKKDWVSTTSDDLNFDVEGILRLRKPIKNREDLDNAIKILAVHILKFNDNQRLIRKTVAQYFLDIKAAAERLGYDKETIRKIAEEIFRSYNISESHIRKVIPHELKDQGRTNLRYRPGQVLTKEYDPVEYEDVDDTEIRLKNAIERIKDVEAENRVYKEKIRHSIMIGQETRIYKGSVTLPYDKDHSLPLIIAINLKEDRLEYVEIDTEAIKLSH